MGEFQSLSKLLRKYVEDGLPGCGIIIAKHGEILFEEYVGWSDVEKQKPLSRESLFRQASLSKIAIYTTLMKFYEQGKFLMTDPLYEYFPEWRHSVKRVVKPNGVTESIPVKPITIKHVMNMTCGLPYDMKMDDSPSYHPISQIMAAHMRPLREKGYYTLREQIRAMAEVPLAFEPGERWLYGFASELAAGLLEVLSGKPAETVIKQELFDPLGMKDSANYLTKEMEPHLVKSYYLYPGKKLGDPDALYALSPEEDAKSVGPLGTVSGFSRVITNCWDYTKFMQMLANGGRYRNEKILGRKTIDLMRTNTLTHAMIQEDFSNTYLNGYGYGYGVRTLMNPYQGQHNGSMGAFGWTGGSGTWAEADPSEGVSIVYMHNLQPNLEEYHHLRMRAVAYGCLH